MKYFFIQFFKLLFGSILFWTLMFNVFILIRYVGRANEQVGVVKLSKEIPVSEYLIFGAILGVIVGVVYGVIEFIFDKYLAKAINIGFILIVKSAIYMLLLIFALSFISYLVEDYMEIDVPNESRWWITSEIFWLVVGYFFVCSLLFSFFRLSSDKFGQGVIFNMLIGKYRKPREVERIFMFLDLKSSTTIAESLGHLKYSRFIQDCFFYLNRIVNKYDAEIYQYVGDEAVLSWKMKKGLRHSNCINLFFDYDRKIKRHSRYYMKKYGVVPQFKAGLHSGKIILAEVGTIKKELAYHGDVINTTSRIQEQCNEYNESLLISEDLLLDINLDKRYKAIPLGEESLEGKVEQHRLFAIHRA